jgi:uncharacterized protein YkwD
VSCAARSCPNAAPTSARALGSALSRPRPISAVLVLALVAVGLVGAPAHADRSSRAEARLLALMTQEREATGAPAWSRLDDLTSSAVRWSARMAQDYGAEGGQRHNPRLAEEVCCHRRIAENVGWVSGADRDLDAAVDRLHAAFMASDGHRANVLAGAHSQVGVGADLHPSGNLYVTVVFREPDGSAPSGTASGSAGSSGGGNDGGTRSEEPTATEATPSPTPSPSVSASHTPADGAGSRTEVASAAPADGPEAAPEGGTEELAPPRDPDELVRLARWALAEHDRQLKLEILEELEATLTRLGDGALRVVEALRWVLGRQIGTAATS